MIIKRLAEFTKVLSNTVITNKSGVTYEHQTAYNLIRLVLKGLRKTGGTLYLIGNGGSNAICSHAAVDILNKYNVKVNPITDSSLITCMVNDYGNELIFNVPLFKTMEKNDILIAVSSSGQSANIIAAVGLVADMSDALIITFSGFKYNNPLRNMGTYNFWLDSHDYGIVEIGHSLLLHLLTD